MIKQSNANVANAIRSTNALNLRCRDLSNAPGWCTVLTVTGCPQLSRVAVKFSENTSSTSSPGYCRTRKWHEKSTVDSGK